MYDAFFTKINPDINDVTFWPVWLLKCKKIDKKKYINLLVTSNIIQIFPV